MKEVLQAGKLWPFDSLIFQMLFFSRVKIIPYNRERRINVSFSLFFLKGDKGMIESSFQKSVIKEIKERFPEAIVLKNDPTYIQGIPDLTVFNGEHWATLEVKKSNKASHQPNQDYYVEKMNSMSFSAFIFPENKEEILNELERHFKS